MTSEPLDPTETMAEHAGHWTDSYGYTWPDHDCLKGKQWPCLPYRLAAELASCLGTKRDVTNDCLDLGPIEARLDTFQIWHAASDMRDLVAEVKRLRGLDS